MPSLEVKHVFNGSLSQVFQALRSYDLYPKYLQNITHSEPAESSQKNGVAYRFELKLIKKFYYTLELKEKAEKQLTWTLIESNIMKKNNGFWKLKKISDKKTEATYGLDVTIKGFVPKALTDKLTETTLPLLFKDFQKMIDELSD